MLINNMKKIPDVTIAICAYNEERNIRQFLSSVFSQKARGYRIKEIILISDGSTDRTVSFARSLKHPKLRILAFSHRLGKSERLNLLYRNFLESDILVQFDADVILVNEHCVTKLIKPLLTNKKVVMTSGKAIPFKADTFLEKAIHMTSQAYEPIRNIKHGNNKFTVQGRILAFKKTFLNTIKIPSDVIGNDAYVYFACVRSGFMYKYVKDAKVYFYLPKTVRDHMKQNVRFEAVKDKMKKYFPEKLIEEEFFIPKKLMIRALLTQFIKNPVLGIFIFFVNKYCRIIAKKEWRSITGKWQVAESTKYLKA